MAVVALPFDGEVDSGREVEHGLDGLVARQDDLGVGPIFDSVNEVVVVADAYLVCGCRLGQREDGEDHPQH